MGVVGSGEPHCCSWVWCACHCRWVVALSLLVHGGAGCSSPSVCGGAGCLSLLVHGGGGSSLLFISGGGRFPNSKNWTNS